MIPRVIEILYAGLPNPAAELLPASQDAFGAICRDLQASQPPAPRRIPLQSAIDGSRVRCYPPRSGRTFLFVLEDGRLVYVNGSLVDWPDQVWSDPDQRLVRFAIDVLGSGTPPRVECVLCKPDEEISQSSKCRCAARTVRTDLSAWASTAAVVNNNCYSYALNLRFCQSNGGGPQPGGPKSRSVSEVLAGLRRDGLLPVTRKKVLSVPGHYVALFSDGGSRFHFIRLDGRHWTHMWNAFAASACDGRRRPIPREKAEAAFFEGHTFHSYHEVPAGTTLNHCG